MASPQDQTPAPTLEKIAVEKGWATPEQIKAAVRYQAQKKVSISQALVALGILTDVQVKRAMEGRKARVPGKLDPSTTAMIKGYRIERRLGAGGMGEVFLAHQISLDRPVALKILPPHLAKDEEFIERFVSEARAAGKVAHENIVAAVDVGESNGRYFFVMELVDGPTLQQVIAREGALPEKRALEVARQVARGLKHAHFHGLIHRDIKPANIMFTSENAAKICDFGLAREIDADVTLTMPGIVQSSPAYTSPEQCRGRHLDHRTDMYSLGVTLFEMLTAKRPFTADTAAALFIKHATEAPPEPQSLNPAISAGAQQLVLRLLRKEPAQRFETYDQLIEAIDAVPSAKPPPKLKTRPARAVVVRKRFPWTAVVVAVALLGAGAGISLWPKPAPEVAKPMPVDPEIERLRRSVAELEQKAKAREEERPVPEVEVARPVPPPEPPPPAPKAEAEKPPKVVEEVAQPKPEPPPKVKIPVGPPEHVQVLRTPSRRADPRERAKAVAAFRATASRSAIHRAAEVFLSAEMTAPKGLDEYLAALPVERADSLTTADHQGQFVGMALRIAEAGDGPKDALYLFALAHAEELLSQNVRPDGEAVRVAKLQAARTIDYWGLPATINRMALARLLAAGASPAELKRAAEPIATAVDFPSRLLVALAAFREKEVDPAAASTTWKRLASYGKETAVSKACEEVAERLKRASVCDGCSGQGKYPCRKCAAQGNADCDRCKGTGRVRESDGMGFIGTVPCQGCKQKGRILCPVCQGGKVARCEKCEGKKIRKAVAGAEFRDVLEPHRCADCRGTGGVFSRVAFPCPSCDGVGRFPSR